MATFLRRLRRWAQRHRTALRALLVIAALAVLIEGFWLDRSVLHLLLLHPLVLAALAGALILTEEPDPPGSSHDR